MNTLVFLALALAATDWVAVARGAKKVRYFSKPAAIVAIILWALALTRGPHDAWQARFFIPGLVFSLAGDVFLLLPGEWFFVLGLGAFLLAHVCYIIGLNPTLPPVPPLPGLVLSTAVAGMAASLFRRIVAGLHLQGKSSLRAPVALYTAVIGVMLLSAWFTLFRPEWIPRRRFWVILGASLFCLSDAVLALERFVSPGRWKRVVVIATYHLAQMALVASIAF